MQVFLFYKLYVCVAKTKKLFLHLPKTIFFKGDMVSAITEYIRNTVFRNRTIWLFKSSGSRFSAVTHTVTTFSYEITCAMHCYEL
jgi:hypothetical protein